MMRIFWALLLALSLAVPAEAGFGKRGNTDGVGFQTVYSPIGLDFSGTDQYGTRGAALTGVADSQSGIASVWLRLDGGDASNLVIFEGGVNVQKPAIFRNNSDAFIVQGLNAAGGTILNLSSTTAYTSGATWRHVLMSWDLSTAGTGRLYITNVSDLTENTYTDDTIDYTTTDSAVAARVNGTLDFNGCISDLYVNYGEYLDFDLVDNRRLFITAGGKPVRLGSQGARPTGNIPIVFFSGRPSTFITNDGSGGGYTPTGTPPICDSRP